jgi:hypothetical protein
MSVNLRELKAQAARVVRALRRYHVTTFGCQMNAHDSERIKPGVEKVYAL